MKKYLMPALLASGSVVLALLAYFKLAPMTLVEVFGFVTGAACVWLVAKDNIWNWPLGIANAAFYIYIFFGAKLYADMSLQVMYVILGFIGWYMWLFGGNNKTKLEVRNVGAAEVLVLIGVSVVSTYFMRNYLISVGDSAPFLDALTTVMSLAAQYLLTKKFIENWYIWLAVDVIYVGLYFSRGLYLTAVLYAVFFAMCLVGLKEWRANRIEHLALAERGSDV